MNPGSLREREWIKYAEGRGNLCNLFSELISPNFDIHYHDDDSNSEREAETRERYH
jgi:hypothetical protein